MALNILNVVVLIYKRTALKMKIVKKDVIEIVLIKPC